MQITKNIGFDIQVPSEYDGEINIATGRSRKETHWKNQTLNWSDLLHNFSATHRTAESFAEYMAAKKPRQDEIKDIGGFVGGTLAQGKRRKGSVISRQLLTLDIDHTTEDIWFLFTCLFNYAGCVYSTHKHTTENPRLRLIIPIDRAVFPDEYEALGRYIAGKIGIENFDITTFQAERLMYWPSTSKDGEFFFDYQNGPWLNADEVLSFYRDWKDTSEWPVSVRQSHVITRSMSKQGDPLEKPGIVGVFCRTYDIHEAIETFLADIYEPSVIEGRYTYKQGSTGAGLVIYDDKFAFSHHGTDPISGKLCNAFDLVRIHKFGLKDEDAKEGTPSTKLPSFLAMCELALQDKSVVKQMGLDKLEEVKDDFTTWEEIETEETEDANNEWLGHLKRDTKGHCLNTIDNVVLILNNDARLKGRFALNEFEKREVALKDLPWRKVTPQTKYLTDSDDASLRHYIEKKYGISSLQKIRDAVAIITINNSFHPVREYFDALSWDREPRLEKLFIDYLGAADNEYTRAATRKAFTAAVARISNPGVKFDYCLVIVGKQGEAKSQIIDRMGGQWFSDSFTTVQGKEAYEQIQGVWLVEIAELAGFKKAEVESIKHFISKREDRYRVAYGRRLENFPRQCVFFGTTNRVDFLRDPTGNRRFWPIKTHIVEPTKNVFTDLTESEVGQLWAEAMHYYKKGEKLYLTPDLEKQAFEAQSDHSEKDDRAGIIEKYLDTLLPDSWEEMSLFQRREYLSSEFEPEDKPTKKRKIVCAAEIFCELFGGNLREMNFSNVRFIHEVLQNTAGWKRTKSNRTFKLYGSQKAYERMIADDRK